MPPAFDKVLGMDTWPFTFISSEDLAALTERERAQLEALVTAFLAFAAAEHADGERPDLRH